MGSFNALEAGLCQRTVEGESKMKVVFAFICSVYSYQVKGMGTNIEEASVAHWDLASIWVSGLFTSSCHLFPYMWYLGKGSPFVDGFLV